MAPTWPRKESLTKGLDRGVSGICNTSKDGAAPPGREMPPPQAWRGKGSGFQNSEGDPPWRGGSMEQGPSGRVVPLPVCYAVLRQPLWHLHLSSDWEPLAGKGVYPSCGVPSTWDCSTHRDCVPPAWHKDTFATGFLRDLYEATAEVKVHTNFSLSHQLSLSLNERSAGVKVPEGPLPVVAARNGMEQWAHQPPCKASCLSWSMKIRGTDLLVGVTIT